MIELMIDPGHGGIDKGGGTNDTFIEKDINLKISLYQYLRTKELGIESLMTRYKDITLNNDKRAKKTVHAQL